MTSGQTRVLVLLGVLLALEAALSPTVKAGLKDPRSFLAATEHTPALVAYGVGALALIGLAAVAPNLATSIAVLMLLLVVLSHGSAISGLIDGATGAVNALAGQGSK